MTQAVCFRCGAIKFGAFCPCPECGALPKSEDDLAISLAMTDHYFDAATLDQMGASVREKGKPPDLDPETYQKLIETIREAGGLPMLTGMIHNMGNYGTDTEETLVEVLVIGRAYDSCRQRAHKNDLSRAPQAAETLPAE